jgi:uncharacterized protein involved in exopolysaccharide biosynthesis
VARVFAAGGLLTASEWYGPLRRQRLFIAIFVLSAVATALLLTYVYSEKYEAYTAISYRVQEVTRFKAQQNEALGSPAPQAPFKVIGSTLQEVLKSDAVLEDVVKALRLDVREPRDYSGPWYREWYQRTKDWLREYSGKAWQLLKYGRIVEDDPVAVALAELRNNIKVTNRDSYIFHLYVRDRYPERAARIANYLAEVVTRWLLEFDRQPGRSRAEQLGSLLAGKRVEMEQRRADIEALLNLNQVASVQLETERLTENQTSLQLELSRLSSEIARAQARQASVQNKLAVKQRILGPDPGAPAEPVEFIPPEDFKKLASQRVFEDVELKSLLAKREALQQSMDAVSTRLRKLPAVQAKLESLKVSLASSEREYTLLRDGYSEAAVRATSAVSEVRVLNPAAIPTSPVAPIKIYHVGLAGALSLLLAIGLVYLLDFLGIEWLFSPAPRPRESVPVLSEPAGRLENAEASHRG